MSIILFDTWRCEGSSISFQTLHFFSNKVWLCNCLFAPNVTGVGGFFFLLFLSFHLGASNSEIPLCDGKHFFLLVLLQKGQLCLICWFCLCFSVCFYRWILRQILNSFLFPFCVSFLGFLFYLQTGRNVYAETFCVYGCQ